MSTFVALLDAEPIQTRRALLAALQRTGALEAPSDGAADWPTTAPSPGEDRLANGGLANGGIDDCAAEDGFEDGAGAVTAPRTDVHGADAVPMACGRGVLRRLLRSSPELVLVGAAGPGCLAALAHRLLRPRSRLLIWQGERPARGWMLSRLAARLADGVLLGCGATPQDAVARPGGARPRLLDVPGPYDVAAFLRSPVVHAPGAQGGTGPVRIAVQGHLSLDGGGLDVLGEAATLCEQQPGRRIHLDWIGEGELRGVLEAQLLVSGLSHRFHGVLDDDATARLYRSCDILLAAHRRDVPPRMLAGAMASGLLVLFDAGCASARALVRQAGCGVDLGRPGALAEALGELLARPPAELEALRAAGRRRAVATAPAAFERRVASAVRRLLEATDARPMPAAPGLGQPAGTG